MSENIDKGKIIFNAMKECGDLAEKLKAEGKNGDYILIYSKGYFQGEYDTKQKIKSELEKYKKAYELETYERQKFIDELETWKKIAEFMADFINMYTLSGEENQYCHRVIDCQEIGGSRSCIECIIDWARKEVENEQNNNT